MNVLQKSNHHTNGIPWSVVPNLTKTALLLAIPTISNCETGNSLDVHVKYLDDYRLINIFVTTFCTIVLMPVSDLERKALTVQVGFPIETVVGWFSPSSEPTRTSAVQ